MVLPAFRGVERSMLPKRVGFGQANAKMKQWPRAPPFEIHISQSDTRPSVSVPFRDAPVRKRSVQRRAREEAFHVPAQRFLTGASLSVNCQGFHSTPEAR